MKNLANARQAITLQQLIKESSLIRMDQEALVGKKGGLSYRQLDEQSRYLSHCLQQRPDLKGGDVIGVVGGRDARTLVAQLGVLRAGFVVMPLDESSTDPSSPLPEFARSVACRIILKAGPAKGSNATLSSDDLMKDAGYFDPELSEEDKSTGGFLFFTSGSSWPPKPVLVSTQQIARRLSASVKEFGFDHNLRTLWACSTSFDLSLFVTMVTLAAGGTIVTMSGENCLCQSDFEETFKDYQINFINQVPSWLVSMAGVLQPASLTGLRYLFSGGETLSPDHAALIAGVFQPEVFCNLYGPTEATIFVSSHRIRKENLRDLETVPLGLAAQDTLIYILNPEKELCPPLVRGEIGIGGPLVCRYLGDEQGGFIKNPHDEGLLYLTGDYGLINSKGELEFLGREDDQVKVSGIRFSLSELEALLLREKAVRNCKILPFPTENSLNPLLVVFFEKTGDVSLQKLRELISERVRAHSLNLAFQDLKSWPLNQNLKTDTEALRQAWQKPEATEALSGHGAVIAGIMKELTGQDAVSLNLTFLQAGGTSLLAIRFRHELQKRLGLEVSLKDLLNRKMPLLKIPDILRGLDQVKPEKPDRVLIRAEGGYNWQKASLLQRGLWNLLIQNEALIPTFQMNQLFEVQGYQPDHFRNTLQEIFASRPFLLSAFREGVGGAEIKPGGGEVSVEYCKEATFQPHQFTRQDLEAGHLIRVKIFEEKQKTRLLFCLHHLISDAGTLARLVRELDEGLRDHEKNRLSQSPWTDNPETLNQSMESWHDSQEAGIFRNFWKNLLKDPGVLPTFARHLAAGQAPYVSHHIAWQHSPEETKAFCQAAQQLGVSPFLLSLSLLKIMLARIYSTGQFFVNVALDLRGHWGAAKTLGLISGYIPVPARVNAGENLSEFLEKSAGQFYECFQHASLSLAGINSVSAFSVASIPVFFEFTHNQEEPTCLIPLPPKEGLSDALLLISVSLGSTMSISIRGCTGCFPDKTLFSQQMSVFRNLINGALQQSEKNPELRHLPVRSAGDSWNFQHQPFPLYPELSSDTHLISEFEKVVRSFPDQVALAGFAEQLSFRSLHSLSSRVAHWLKEHADTGPGKGIGLMMDRSMLLLPVIIGIMKTRSFYIPLSQYDPDSHTEAQLALCGISSIVCDEKYRERLNRLSQARTLVPAGKDLQRWPDNYPQEDHSPEDTAYVIFTSGSTGVPKGVEVPHRGIAKTVLFRKKYYGLSSRDCILQYPSVFYDSAVNDYFSTLLSGACLLMIREEERLDPEALGRHIQNHRVSHFMMTPALYQILLENQPERLRHVKQVVLCGDDLPSGLIKKHRDVLPHTRVYNEYGPAETSVWTTVYEFSGGEDRVPIGRPVALHQVVLTDPEWGACVPGQAGEICVSGPGLAKGYLNDPGLTREKFIPDPYGPSRMYRTRDLAETDANGLLYFLGRADLMLKIAGVFVNPETTEEALRRLPGIQAAVVCAPEDSSGRKVLMALVQTEPSAKLPPHRTLLKNILPDALIPAFLVATGSIPLTQNGKTDRSEAKSRCLRWLKDHKSADGNSDTSARALLSGIWKDITGHLPASDKSELLAAGATSLDVLRFCGLINQALGLPLSPETLSQNSSFAALLKLAGVSEGKTMAGQPEGLQVISGFWNPVRAASRFLLAGLREKKKHAFNILDVWKTDFPISPEEIRDAVLRVFHEFPVLSSGFVFEGGSLKARPMKVSPEAVFSVTATSLASLESLLDSFYLTPLNIKNPPLVRFALFCSPGDEKHLAILAHHAIADETGMRTIARAVLRHHAPCKFTPSPQEKPGISCESDEQRCREFWKKALKDCRPLSFPTDYPRQEKQNTGKVHTFFLESGFPAPQNDRPGLVEASTALALTLSWFGNTRLVTFGMPVDVRQLASPLSEAGCLLNSLPLVVEVPPDIRLQALTEVVRETINQALWHGMLPFEEIIKGSRVGVTPCRFPLYDAGLTWEVLEPEIRADQLALKRINHAPKDLYCQNDFWLYLHQEPRGIRCELLYDASLYLPDTINRLSERFQKNFLEIVNQKSPPPSGEGVFDAFAAVAGKYPGHEALWHQGNSVSYAELLRKCESLARKLTAAGAGPGKFVYIYMDKGIEMITGILSVIRTGAAFIPVDISQPPGRLRVILEDVEDSLKLTSPDLRERLKACSGVICPGEAGADLEKSPESGSRLNPDSSICYGIYTSGSSGIPKAACITHSGLLNTIRHSSKAMQTGPGRRVLQFSSIGFDVAIWEIFTALLNGGSLVLADNYVRYSQEDLIRLVSSQKVDTMFIMATYLSHLQPADFPGVSLVVTGGEMFGPAVISAWAKDKELWYVYGPTECAIFQSMHRCDPSDLRPPTVGRPLPGMQFHLTATGTEGLWALGISGVGTSPGYLNRDDLNREKFISSPEGIRIYQSGDLVRKRPDGLLDFHGRADRQIKIQGYRVEIGETESAVLASGYAESCCVLVREINHSRSLHCLATPGKKFPELCSAKREQALRQNLEETIPSYMIPASIHFLKTLPKNTNGKIDRNQLQIMLEKLLSQPEPGPEFSLSREEAVLSESWKKYLELRVIHPDTDFFRAGGTSLTAVRIAAELSRWNLVFIDFPEKRTLRAIASGMREPVMAGLPEDCASTSPENEGEGPAHDAQVALWLGSLNQEARGVYDLPVLFCLRGKVCKDSLQKSLVELQRKHPALRTRLSLRGDQLWQKTDSDLSQVAFVNLESESKNAVGSFLESEFHRPLDLEKGELSRFVLIRTSHDTLYFLMNLHHTISDAWSLNILMQDLSELYRAVVSGAFSPVGDLPMNRCGPVRSAPENSFKSLVYWQAKLSNGKFGHLVAARSPDKNRSGPGRELSLPLSPGLISRVSALSESEGVTPFVVWASLTALMLKELITEPLLRIATVSSNRPSPASLARVGMYAETLIMQFSLPENFNRQELIRIIRDEFIQTMKHADMTWLEVARTCDGADFEVMVSIQEDSTLPFREEKEICVSEIRFPARLCMFPLSFIYYPGRDSCLRIISDRDLISQKTRDRFPGLFQKATEVLLEYGAQDGP